MTKHHTPKKGLLLPALLNAAHFKSKKARNASKFKVVNLHGLILLPDLDRRSAERLSKKIRKKQNSKYLEKRHDGTFRVHRCPNKKLSNI